MSGCMRKHRRAARAALDHVPRPDLGPEMNRILTVYLEAVEDAIGEHLQSREHEIAEQAGKAVKLAFEVEGETVAKYVAQVIRSAA